MSRFNIKQPLSELAARIRATQGKLEDDHRNLLDLLGTQMLSLAQQDYVTKARGGTASDGTKWAKLSRATLEARVRRRAPARAIVRQRRDLAAQIKKLTKAKDAPKRKALIQKRQALKVKLEALIDKEMGRHEIGVDTGLQRSSATPGFKGTDGKGGNVKTVTGDSVTVGYARNYSKFFDEKRPLMPKELPPPWIEKLEKTTQLWAEKIVRDILE
ncbi:MAG: hypothetical protein IT428_32510 [Planctomycetaceae bacterium]|nr:hypothetical protein [Planctomycetaceae bacterium]